MAKRRKVGPLDVFELLPKTNCGRCESKICMSFAVQLVERTMTLEDCPVLLEDKYRENLAKLREILKPPVKEVVVGEPPRQVKIGGELVVRRHELRYFNPTAFAVVLDDEFSPDELRKRIKEVEGFKYTYIGRELKLDMVAVRSTSRDPAKFRKAVENVIEATDMPLVLWSLDPEVMQRGLEVARGRRPLLYAATKDNWARMGELAVEHGCPLVVYSPNNLKTLRSLVKTLLALGVKDLALDAGAGFGRRVAETITNLTMLRNAACKEEDELLGFPLVGSAALVWEEDGARAEVIKWKEACLASMMILRYVDLLMLKSTDVWVLLPLLILRENLYTDPRKPVSVDPGLRVIGKPDENSPVMFTTNFALTYFTVSNDIESAKIDCYLLVVDTEGISVESSVAGRKLTAEKVADAMKEARIEQKVKHRKLIIPGLAARLKGEIEELTGWEVLVGPKDSSGIPEFLSKHWPSS